MNLQARFLRSKFVRYGNLQGLGSLSGLQEVCKVCSLQRQKMLFLGGVLIYPAFSTGANTLEKVK